jgi:hypothetical protein
MDVVFYSTDCQRNDLRFPAMPAMYLQSLGWVSFEIRFSRALVLKTM